MHGLMQGALPTKLILLSLLAGSTVLHNLMRRLIPILILFILSQDLNGQGLQKTSADFPSNCIIEKWHPSYLIGTYLFYTNHRFLFIHGNVGKTRKIFDIGTWNLVDGLLTMKIDSTVGLRPIGEPINPEMRSAAHPDDYLLYAHYVKFEEWKIEKRELAIIDLIQCSECIVDLNRKADSVAIDVGKFKIDGKFKVASCKKLTDDDLNSYSKENLRLMRNEIFARYGFKFKSTDLRKHFESQDWYHPERKNVDEYLTDLEKVNLALIKKHEAY